MPEPDEAPTQKALVRRPSTLEEQESYQSYGSDVMVVEEGGNLFTEEEEKAIQEQEEEEKRQALDLEMQEKMEKNLELKIS